LDYDLPESLGGRLAWYAMPLGVPTEVWAKTASPSEKVLAIAEAAETMATLHDRGIAHRDIKPANLLVFDGRCHIVDFGLVNYPAKSTLTGYKEQIGPLWTMAPEVRRNGNKADPLPADVFSLAKSLWILLTLSPQGFDGQYSGGSEISIRRLFGDSYVSPLENLLASATAHNHLERPSMQEFATGLRAWLDVSDDFLLHNPLQWQETLSRLFPVGIPAQATWRDPEQIVAVLNLLGQTPSLNHMFYPSFGGNDLLQARLSEHEEGCIELILGRCNLVRPINLSFEGFPDGPEWNYFRLETGTLAACGAYEEEPEFPRISEDVTEINSHVYAELSCWDDDRYENGPVPATARPVTRWFTGAFIIFQKTSFYNLAEGRLDAYSGRHNEMDAVDFRSHVEELRDVVRTQGIDLRSSRIQQREAYRRSAKSSSIPDDPW
jgi:hypothetical protein